MTSVIIVSVAIGLLILYHFILKNPMSQQEKVIEAFEHFVGVNILYQTFDGELFVELPDAQVYATSLLSQAIITIPRPLSVPDEVLPNEGKWVYLPNGSTSVLKKNLIVNGFGELGGLVNFSKFQQHIQNDFIEFQLGANYQGEQGYIVDGKALLMTDALIPVTPGQLYSLQFMATTLNPFAAGDLYQYEAGVAFFDADGVQIENSFVGFNFNNLRLKRDLVAGDTYMVVTAQPNFVYGAGTDALRNIAFLDHTFKNGRRTSTYTRNVIKNAYPALNYTQVVGNDIRVMLNQPYAGATVAQNTRVVNVQNGGFHSVKVSGTHAGSGENIHRTCFGNTDEFQNNFNVSRYAKYMKFFVKQTSQPYFELLISDISLKEIYPGDDVTPKGHGVDIYIPEVDAAFLPNGYKYFTGVTLCESFDGTWITRPSLPIPE